MRGRLRGWVGSRSAFVSVVKSAFHGVLHTFGDRGSIIEYETRTTKIVVLPKGEPIFSESATSIEIVDDAAGEFLKLDQSRGDPLYANSFLIEPHEWPALRAEIDAMIKTCRS